MYFKCIILAQVMFELHMSLLVGYFVQPLNFKEHDQLKKHGSMWLLLSFNWKLNSSIKIYILNEN